MEQAENTTRRRMRGMGRIFERKGGAHLWISYYHRGKEIRESAESPDRKQAEKLLKARLKEIAADQLGAKPFIGPTQQRVTVGELLGALEAHYRLQGTLSQPVTSHLKPVKATFGDRRAVNVTSEAVDSYIESRLAEKVAPSTINRELQLLAQSYRLAIQRNHLSTMPAIRRLSETGRERKGFFEMAELQAVIHNLPEHLQDFTRFAFFTGWRKGEIISLRWSDVDGQVIRLRPEEAKNKHGRQVPLEGELRAILERRWAARQYTSSNGTASLSAYVFHRRGEPIGDFKKSWKKACKAAGVPGKLFHDARRTAVRNMVRAGVPERVAMEISGHRTRSIFDRYNIVSGDDLRVAIRRTQEHLSGGQPNVVILPVAIPQSSRGVSR